MYHFFVDSSAIGEGKVKITGADLNHMKNVLRMKTGEAVLISAFVAVISVSHLCR